jgi:enamine deaminase RidA (YjgF/YER057c/UK114 family)
MVVAVNKEPKNFGNFMEEAYGFSEAVKVGDTIYVSGQTAFGDDGTIAGLDDMKVQMRAAYAGIERALGLYGATMEAVVDETLFVTDMTAAVTVANEVRKEVYGGKFEMASTLCEIKALGSPQLLIEIKCTARV